MHKVRELKLQFPLSSRVFPITIPPLRDLEGTHGDRVAGDNTQHSHRLLSFSSYATRLRTKRIQTRPLTCTFRQARRSLFSPPCGSCSVFEVAHTVYKHAMNECSLGVGVPPATATKLQYHLRKAQISLLPKATISRTLCVRITYLAVAARVPSFKLHIPCIRTL